LRVKDVTSTSVVLEWTASTDNIEVTGYEIYRDSLLIGTTEETYYMFTDLQPMIEYSFTVRTRDTAGNLSEHSEPYRYTYSESDNIRLAANQYGSAYVKANGELWRWGGFATEGNKTTAVPVAGMTEVQSVAFGSQHLIALKTDGTVWTWGMNLSGQLGTGDTIGRTEPGQVAGLSGIIAVAASGSSSYALKNDGTVWAWGATVRHS